MWIRLDLAQLPLNDLRLSGLQGRIDVSISAMQWNHSGCSFAKGIVKIDVFSHNAGTLQWQGPILSGPVSYKNSALGTHLAGSSGDTRIRTDLTLDADGMYRANVAVQTQTLRFQKLLTAYGFEHNGNSFNLHETGKLVR